MCARFQNTLALKIARYEQGNVGIALELLATMVTF